MSYPSQALPRAKLASPPCLGHMGTRGEVAEWLKAAVC